LVKYKFFVGASEHVGLVALFTNSIANVTLSLLHSWLQDLSPLLTPTSVSPAPSFRSLPPLPLGSESGLQPPPLPPRRTHNR
jgi:hypothetical protein